VLSPKRILVFRIGQLGDTIVALPAMWAVRNHFPKAQLTLLCDRHPRRHFVLAPDLLAGAGLFDEFLSYPVDNSRAGSLVRPLRRLRLLWTLRQRAFDLLVYLAPSRRQPAQVERDRRFFAAAGIKRFLGLRGFPRLPAKAPGQPLPAVSSEADLLLARIAADDIPVPPPGQGCFELNLGPAEEQQVQTWLRALPSDGGRPWVGVGPGSKMAAKRWPPERFSQVGAQLVAQHEVWPVVFGGPSDRALGDTLLGDWGRGYNAAGALSLRPAAAALKRCRLYLGNDTGTMHLAAAVGVPCAAIFSAREIPGRWYPNGEGHRVFRSPIDCEGCGLLECIERRSECLQRITTDAVLAGCVDLLSDRSCPVVLQSRGLVVPFCAFLGP
jgi:ADP-heptose:LPS heptosyltransferase